MIEMAEWVDSNLRPTTGDAAAHRVSGSRVASRVPADCELAARAEQAGVDAVWVAEGPIARDAFITLSAIAVRTRRVELGTGVVNPFTRHPAQLASSFATLDEAPGGRGVCGTGSACVTTWSRSESTSPNRSRPPGTPDDRPPTTREGTVDSTGASARWTTLGSDSDHRE